MQVHKNTLGNLFFTQICEMSLSQLVLYKFAVSSFLKHCMLLYLENDRGRGIANLLQLLSYFLMFQMEMNKTGILLLIVCRPYYMQCGTVCPKKGAYKKLQTVVEFSTLCKIVFVKLQLHSDCMIYSLYNV